MIKHYGVWGFFFTVFSLLIMGGILNRGAFVSPLMPIEMWIKQTIKTDKFLALLSAQAFGGFMAFRCATGLWFYSIKYSSDHNEVYHNLPCAFSYKVSFPYVLLYEFAACFLIRFLMFRLPLAYKQYIVPALFAGALSIALAFIGVPGLNPVTVSSRLQGCPGLDLQWFIITYWVLPVLGWLLAARFDGKKRYAKAEKSASAQANGAVAKPKMKVPAAAKNGMKNKNKTE